MFPGHIAVQTSKERYALADEHREHRYDEFVDKVFPQKALNSLTPVNVDTLATPSGKEFPTPYPRTLRASAQ